MQNLQKHLKQIVTWFDHMTGLPRIHHTAVNCGFRLGRLEQYRNTSCGMKFTVEDGLIDKINEDEMELR